MYSKASLWIIMWRCSYELTGILDSRAPSVCPFFSLLWNVLPKHCRTAGGFLLNLSLDRIYYNEQGGLSFYNRNNQYICLSLSRRQAGGYILVMSFFLLLNVEYEFVWFDFLHDLVENAWDTILRYFILLLCSYCCCYRSVLREIGQRREEYSHSYLFGYWTVHCRQSGRLSFPSGNVFPHLIFTFKPATNQTVHINEIVDQGLFDVSQKELFPGRFAVKHLWMAISWFSHWTKIITVRSLAMILVLTYSSVGTITTFFVEVPYSYRKA